MSAKVEYRGGIPEIKKTGDTVADAFPDCLVVCAPSSLFKSFKVPYANILDVSLVPEGKRSSVLNVEYETAAGFNSVVVLAGKETPILYNSLQKSRQKYLQRNPAQNCAKAESPAVDSPVDVAAEIQKFFELKEKGAISEEEFNAKKAQLLGL